MTPSWDARVRATGRDVRDLLEKPGTILIPGAFDALAARILESEGFGAVYVGGHGAAAAAFGLPDIGLVTQSEMADHVARIVDAVGIPVIADADEGHGDIANVVRTVHRFERAGAAAIQLEDQAAPKRCGHMAGKRLVDREAMVAKIEAAVAARTDPNTVIIARTDAIAVTGVEDAAERLAAYADAGADIIFPDAPTSLEDIRHVANSVRAPLMINISEGGKTPPFTLDELNKQSVKIVIYPSAALFAAAYAVRQLARELRTAGNSTSLVGRMVLLDELHDLAGLGTWQDLEARFSTDGHGSESAPLL
jgi:2,3-dimethylmalate lyase